ncbi:MAG: hypothetical protein JSV50_03330, partial [Desulfobacteraceae bacterium]
MGIYSSYGGYGYGGYWGMPTLGLSNLYNPLSYYSMGAAYSAHFITLIPSVTHCWDLGCLPGP